jgi:hypothetical protein
MISCDSRSYCMRRVCYGLAKGVYEQCIDTSNGQVRGTQTNVRSVSLRKVLISPAFIETYPGDFILTYLGDDCLTCFRSPFTTCAQLL